MQSESSLWLLNIHVLGVVTHGHALLRESSLCLPGVVAADGFLSAVYIPPRFSFQETSPSLARLGSSSETGWPVSPRICLSLPSQHWNYEHTPAHLAFLLEFLGTNSSLYACAASTLLTDNSLALNSFLIAILFKTRMTNFFFLLGHYSSLISFCIICFTVRTAEPTT